MTLTANTSPDSFPAISGYSIVEQLYQGSRTSVYRAVQTATQRAVVIKVLGREYPSFDELVQFRNQYTIAKNLPIPGIVQPLSLEPVGSGYGLVMDDCGGVSLGKYIQQQSLALTEVLEIALQIADILHDLIQHRVVHKDIKPSNILIHPESKQVKLIDFSIASLLPKETQEIQNPNILEGTLAYLAPEQTGRMNRGIDYRADFYALGVTLYQLLTGTLPFSSDDPLELMHCHIAKVPVSVEQVNPDVPRMVGAIVTKLMAKNAEDRYQSAMGLKHDLEQCLMQWKTTGEIAEFELGQRDLSDRFLIPEKLYGRVTEVAQLLAAFERVADGASELMLVAGFSGIGKTAVVNEVHKPIVRQRGYFIKGKFDQFNRNIPLSAFVQALRDLMGQLLSESDGQLAQWRTQTLTALGENGQVLIEVIPELELIIGQQPIATELSGSAAQNRFNLLFQKFIEVFTTAEHPLVLFLDDLQWADSASLQLIKLLMSDNGYLLMLGAYRDNEVSPVHLFILTVEEIRKANAIVNTITLAPLDMADTNHLVADTLNCSRELAQPLTELIDRKTKGNPFFTTQFLKALYEDGQITFDRDRRYWECDIAQVNALALTDDVVEFMALQLQKWSAETQQVLKLAACIGNQFDLTTLAIVAERLPVEAATALWKALQEGLILPTSQVYKFFQDAEQIDVQNSANPTYRFLHDRVQQAAYSLIPDDQKQAAHYQIGQLLLQQISSKDIEERIFELVNQLNFGTALITNQTERDRLAFLNLTACRKARTASAYQAAHEYATLGLSLLGKDTWQQQYEMTLSLYELAAEVASICGAFEQMEQYINIVTEKGHSLLEKTNVYRIRIQSNISQNKLFEAIEIAKQILQDIDVNFPETVMQEDIQHEYEEIRELLGDREIKDLSALPLMTDEKKIVIVQIASSIFSAAYFSGSPLLPLLISLSVRLSIQYGYTFASAYSYAFYGIILCSFLQDVDSAVEFGQLAFQCVSKDDKSTKPEVLLILAVNILHRKAHTREMLPLFREGYEIGLEVGNIEFAGYSANMSCLSSFWLGLPLAKLEQDTRAYFNELVKFNQLTSANYCRIYWQTILNLLGFAEHPSILAGEALQEAEFLSQSKSTVDGYGLCLFYWHKLMLCYLFGEIDQAQNYAVEARPYLIAAAGNVVEPAFYFYDSLIALAELSQPLDQQSEAWQKIVQTQTLLQQQWAQYAPMNHQHKVDLVEAEKCRVLGRNYEAGDWYDRAISGAKANQYTQEEALANELAAKFYLNWGKEKVAAGYMQDAYYGYARWGAKAKIIDLETRYPQLLQPILLQPQSSFNVLETIASITNSATKVSNTTLSDSLDFASVIKAAQSLSSTIELDELLKQLTQIILQNSGGSKCILVLPDHETWQVKAIATPETTELCSIPLDDHPDVPIKLIQYVKRTQTVVTIDNLQTDLPVIDDYLLQDNPKSVLCLPILNQGHLAGILYLKNEMTAGVFTSDRLTVINFLCTQSAISLENARLYQILQRSEDNEHEKATELAQMLTVLQLQNKKLAFRADVDAGLTTHENLSDMLQSTTEAIVQHLDAAFARVWTLNSAENVLELQASAGQYIHLDGPHARVPVGKFKIGLIAEECRPHLTNDVLNDPRVGDKEWAKREGMIAFAGYPLIVENQIMGVMAMFARHTLDDEVLELLSSVADEIASAIKRKYVQKALQESEIELRQKSQQIEQAFQQLQQTQLQMVQSEKMSALGNLVAGVAHEINNPIGFLGGNIQPALDYINDLFGLLDLVQQKYPQLDPEIQEEIETIDLEYIREDLPKLIGSMKTGVDRIRDISTSLRTFSRADSDRPVAFNLHEGIDSTILILKHRLKADDKRPEINVIKNYGSLPQVECYAGQLNQVFMNILANAIDALDESNYGKSYAEIEQNPNSIAITTSVKDNYVKIAIADNGKGMTEEVKQKVFDHLFTTKEVGKGTGLGLAIARQIVVEKHGGSLEVQSELGRGTEFCIRLAIAG